MPLRLLEVTVPRDALASLPEALHEIDIIDFHAWWESESAGIAHMLVHAHQVEALTDLLASRFTDRAPFRLVLLPVEATLPVVEEPEEDPQTAERDRASPGVGPQRISREELYEDISQAARLTLIFVVMVALSTIVAAIGLLRGDIAIIIGAMVIAPLLGPNIGLSLAATLGDLGLAKRAAKAIGASIVTAAALSLLMGYVLPVDPSAPELVARTQPNPMDVVLALAAGVAGSLAFTSGVPAVVVGVMVAVALLPPLVVAGLLAGSGHPSPAWQAIMLGATNVTCINIAAIATFMVQKVSPRTWWDADRAKKATLRAVIAWIILLTALLGLMMFGEWTELT